MRALARADRLGAAAVGVLVALAAILVVLALASGESGAQDGEPTGDYRVNAIFDTAKGIIPGQVLKIAGARAGTIDDVTLSDDFKARIEMTTDARFAPFRADAECQIKPEGLISERFVECDPGTPDAEPLDAVDGVPTVPVESTTVPVAITDLFNVFDMPVRQRFTALVASLGLASAGRGEDVNDVLRRANPTLKLVRDVMGRLARDEQELKDAVAATDRVVAELAQRPERVGDFVDAAGRVVTETAERRTALQRGIHTLPALLDEARPSLDAFDRFARDTTPLLRELRAGAPQATSLLERVVPFSKAARPALRALDETAETGIPVARTAAPVVGLLRGFASAALPTGGELADLVVDLRDSGVTENLLTFVYNTAAATARYDSVGHILPTTIFFDAISGCSIFATTPTPGCSANYTDTTVAQREARGKTPAARGDSRRDATPSEGAPAGAAPAPAPSAPQEESPALTVPGLPPVELPKLPGLPLLDRGSPDRPATPDAAEGLLGFLLG